MTQPFTLGIIGCGGIAQAHLAAAKENNASIIAISDISPDTLNAFLEKVPGASAFSSYTELLDHGGMNAVVICTPPDSHAEVAIAALQRGIHVLCEKPLAATVSDSKAIEEAANASGTKFMMAFRHRFTAAHHAIKAFLDTGELGRVVLFQNVFGGPAQYMKDRWFSKRALSGGGTLMDTSIHSIDLFRHYCGEIASFSGEIDKVFEGTDVEDSSVLSLRSENGALGIIASSWNFGAGVADIRIITEKGSVLYNYGTPTIYRITRLGVADVEEVAVKSTGGFSEQMAHFMETVQNDTTPLTTVKDGRRAVEIVEGIYQQRPLCQ